MSLKEAHLPHKESVFNEWIAKYKDLKPYTQQGMPRTLSADDLVGFNAPNEAWLSQTRPQRGRSGGAGKPPESQTPSTYTVQFDATSGTADKANLLTALKKGQKGGPSATSSISLFIAWEREGASATAPAPWRCASIRF
jgi:hypothetical protein